MFQGTVPEDQLRSILDQLLEVAAANGVSGTIAVDARAPRPRGGPEPGLGRETRPWARVARLAVGDAGDRAPAVLPGFSSSTIRLIVSAFFTVRAAISSGLGERLVHPFVRDGSSEARPSLWPMSWD